MPVVDKRDVLAGMLLGALAGLPIAAVIAGSISWYSLAKHQRQLLRDMDAGMAVIAVEPLPAGQPIKASQLAQRAVLRLTISTNTVLPEESEELAGKAPAISFEKGDLVLRSAFGLAPRAPETP